MEALYLALDRFGQAAWDEGTGSVISYLSDNEADTAEGWKEEYVNIHTEQPPPPPEPVQPAGAYRIMTIPNFKLAEDWMPGAPGWATTYGVLPKDGNPGQPHEYVGLFRKREMAEMFCNALTG